MDACLFWVRHYQSITNLAKDLLNQFKFIKKCIVKTQTNKTGNSGKIPKKEKSLVNFITLRKKDIKISM